MRCGRKRGEKLPLANPRGIYQLLATGFIQGEFMRAAAVAVMVGYVFGGIGSGAGHAHVISDVQLTAAVQSVSQNPPAKTGKVAKTNKTTASAMKTVTYRGYSIEVPSSWPVYWLAADPTQCVRYDINAVYLGTPGPNQDCPAHVIGQAET